MVNDAMAYVKQRRGLRPLCSSLTCIPMASLKLSWPRITITLRAADMNRQLQQYTNLWFVRQGNQQTY